MSLLATAAAIGGGVGLLQTGIGAFSMFGGKKDYERLMRNYPLYKYQEPASYGQAVNVSGQAYAAGSPTTALMEQRIGATTSRSARTAERYAGSSQELMGSVGEAYARELEGLNNLALQDLQYRENARGEYVQSLFTKGQAEQRGKELEYESLLNKWQIQANMAAGRSDFGRQMMWQGIGGAAGAATGYFSTKYMMSELQKMFPAGEVATPKYTLGSGYSMYDPSTWGGSMSGFKLSGAITKPLEF